jgi:hypothetical protein
LPFEEAATSGVLSFPFEHTRLHACERRAERRPNQPLPFLLRIHLFRLSLSAAVSARLNDYAARPVAPCAACLHAPPHRIPCHSNLSRWTFLVCTVRSNFCPRRAPSHGKRNKSRAWKKELTILDTQLDPDLLKNVPFGDPISTKCSA